MMLDENRGEQQTSAPTQGQYGTGIGVEKKKKHLGACILLALAVLVLTGALLAAHFFTVEIERSGHGLLFRVSLRRADAPSDSRTLSLPEEQDTAFSETELTPTQGELPLSEIYAQVIPSVVTVTASASFSQEVATGVILTEDGYIITNNHLLAGGDAAKVLLEDERVFEAVIVARDEASDLAVLKINAKGLQAATLGDSDTLCVGDGVVAIGNPLGMALRGTMTSGIVSAINRDFDLGGSTMTLIQTDAALNNGNSGGPLINSRGEIIGINTAKISGSFYAPSVEGIGFAIPSNTVRQIAGELMELGYVSGRATLRLSVADMDALQRAYLGLPQGVFITAVDEDSHAYAAGLRYGDILVRINDEAVLSAGECQALLRRYAPGDEVCVILYRNGKYFSVSLILEEQIT